MSLSSLSRAPSESASLPDAGPDDQILSSVLYAFAPMHKLAFGVATGAAGAVFMAWLTIAWFVLPSAHQFPLFLLGEFFAGYKANPASILIGAGWGFVVGFFAGWFGAFCRNLALAITALVIRSRAELAQTRGFLDHI